MASLKDLRVRINSVRQTQKITSAMKLVAASKLRRAQEAAEAARPFSERMERMVGSLAEIMGEREDAPAMLRGTGNDETHLFVVATADRGLCGGFNSSITRATRARLKELGEQGKTTKIICVGRKGREQLRPRVRLDDRRPHGRDRTPPAAPPSRRRTEIGRGLAQRFGGRRVRHLHGGLQPLQDGDEPGCHLPAAHPVQPAHAGGGGRGRRRFGRDLRVRAGRGDDPLRPSTAQSVDPDLPLSTRERSERAGRADDGNGQRDAQRRRNDRQADPSTTTGRGRRRSPRS